ncbi:hypothetical protein J6590_006152 [Homalodisca vitripennis]|nr:hypothetical protein J6590_096400 [Homalodisca vitripennis]KAG8327976.1 hypothetical protein J6590_006152 [Homalodisca vitripennis]
MIKRASLPTLPTFLKARIREMSGQPLVQRGLPEPDGHLPATGRCHLCCRKKNRKSSSRCSSCRLFMFREHTNLRGMC